MTPLLFYDTETTGLPLFKEPSEHPDQPHIVQLAAILVDQETRKTISSMDVIVSPAGWIVPDDVAAIHGITTEHAMDVGVGEKTALSMLLEMWRGPGRMRIGHNEQFDARIIRIGLKRLFETPGEVLPISDEWKSGLSGCTAIRSTPLCALPPTEKMRAAKRFHHKTPNLGEAYRHFFGVDLQNAHTAMADVLACRDVWFAIEDMESGK